MLRSTALLLALASGCLAATKPSANDKKPSRATNHFTGEEKSSVTIPAGVEISHRKLWNGVDKKTALIVVRNFSGRDLDYFQLDMSVYPDKEGRQLGSFHGYGALLNGEKRIIKADAEAPITGIRLVWMTQDKKSNQRQRASWYSYDEGFPKGFVRGQLIVFTLNPNDKVKVIHAPAS